MIELIHGTREDHLATLRRALAGGVQSVWSGDLRRNAYLRENVAFAEAEGILTTKPYDDRDAQESGLTLTWLKSDF